MAKIGRNSPCPCGSGKKYKHCQKDTGIFEQANPRGQQDFRERIRQAQQGQGKPIQSETVGGARFLRVGEKTFSGRAKSYFADFLTCYIQDVFGLEWWEAEAAKPVDEQHVLVQWKAVSDDHSARQQDVTDFKVLNGAGFCYLGLANNLYLIAHNVELQSLMVHRLKMMEQFQGAYYELIVAGLLIGAGFELVLEDETNNKQAHCEFSARSNRTGEVFWVEAKIRSVPGVLGKSTNSASTRKDPTAQLTKHVNLALRKPASGRRIVFVDINDKPIDQADIPDWGHKAKKRLEGRE